MGKFSEDCLYFSRIERLHPILDTHVVSNEEDTSLTLHNRRYGSCGRAGKFSSFWFCFSL